jgi:hypothetical protein
MEADTKIGLLASQQRTLIISRDNDYHFYPAESAIVFSYAKWPQNDQAEGSYLSRDDVFRSFGLISDTDLDNKFVRLRHCLLLVIFAGFRNDYQKERPRQIKLKQWVRIVAKFWNQHNLSHSCRELAAKCVEYAKLEFTTVSADKWSSFEDGIRRSLDAVLDGVATNKFLTCTGYDTGFVKSGLHTESGLPMYVNYDLEATKAEAAAEIAEIVNGLREDQVEQGQSANLKLVMQRKQSRKANKSNQNSYPSVLVVRSAFNRCKGTALAKWKRNLDDLMCALNVEAFLARQGKAKVFDLAHTESSGIDKLHEDCIRIFQLDAEDLSELSTWKDVTIFLAKKFNFEDDWKSKLTEAQRAEVDTYISDRFRMFKKSESNSKAEYVKH